MPYTPSDTMPNVNRIPTSRSAMTIFCAPSIEPNGTTASTTNDGTSTSAGAIQ